MRNILFLVAGNHAQAIYFSKHSIRSNSLQQIVYVDEVNQMRGIKSPTVLFCGTYFDRKDIDSIVEEVLIHDGILIKVD